MLVAAAVLLPVLRRHLPSVRSALLSGIGIDGLPFIQVTDHEYHPAVSAYPLANVVRLCLLCILLAHHFG